MKVWRVVGFDDSFKGEVAYIVGCITAGTYVEGFLIDRIEVDGFDVTEKVVDLINSSKFKIQLKCIMLSGITFAGFNIADVYEIYRRTGIPVVVVMKKMPNFKDIEMALRNLSSFERRMEIIRRAGDVHRIEDLFIQICGCDIDFARNILSISRSKGKIPEALRIAHLVASALIHKESKRH